MTETSSPLKHPLPSGILLTGETKNVGNETLYQIQSTNPGFRVGGFISPHTRMEDEAWVEQGAEARGFAILCDRSSLLRGAVAIDSILTGSTTVSHATICGVTMRDGAVVLGSPDEGPLKVSDALLRGNASIYRSGSVAGVTLSGGALVGKPSDPLLVDSDGDVMVVGPIGSEGVDVTLVRTSGKRGYHLSVGCWNGPIEDLMDEVQDRSTDWEGTKAEADLWRAQYESLVPFLTAITSHWAAEREVQEELAGLGAI